MARIKKGDTVIVIAGENKGTQGTVQRVDAKTQRVVVTGVNIVKKAQRPVRAGRGQTQTGIIEFEAPIHISNVMLVDPKSSEPTRIGHTVDANGAKRRGRAERRLRHQTPKFKVPSRALESRRESIRMANLKKRYREEIVPALMRDFGFKNVMQAPRIQKVIVNIGAGDALENAKTLDGAVADLRLITGQQPVITKARKDIANFKLRAGRSIGVKVTLRGERMWSFLDVLANLALPRIRDFRGISPDAFDGRGNYTLGLREQIMFPQIQYDKIDKLRGMEITIVTTARTDEEGRRLLQLIGMPFRSN